MSIFDNVTFMNEASNKADYLKEKQQRAGEQEKAERERYERRYIKSNVGYYTKKNDNDDIDRSIRAYDTVTSDQNRRLKSYDAAYGKLRDISSRVNNSAKDIDDHYDKKPIGLFKGKEKKDWKRKNDNLLAINHKLAKDFNKQKKVVDYRDKSVDRSIKGQYYALDAVNRHMRRHPDQYKESGIFESVEII